MKPNLNKTAPITTLELNTSFGLVEEYIIAYSINPITGELLTATQDKLRLYNVFENSLIADYNIPLITLQEQRRPTYRVKLIEPLILGSGWLVITTKKTIIYFSKSLIASKAIELKDQPEQIIVNQREEDFYVLCNERKSLHSYSINLSGEIESVGCCRNGDPHVQLDC